MITANFKGRIYAVVPDGTAIEGACERCVFYKDMDHACCRELNGPVVLFSDGPVVSCIEGKHHYEELPQ